MITPAKTVRQDNRPEWVRFLEGYCGIKTYNAWRDWTDFITEGPKGLDACPTDDELLRVVKFVADQEKITGITARKLAGWVRWYRHERCADRDHTPTTSEGRQDEVWQMMLRARDHGERWELLVEGGKPLPPAADGGYEYRREWTDADRGELEGRARGRWGDWDKDVNQYKSRFTRARVRAFTAVAEQLEPQDTAQVPF
jgi:hypothetical protein